jgi:SAM-dependent methyltransferase
VSVSKVTTVSVERVDDDGVTLSARGRTGAEDVVVDVCFDGRRVWSFWVLRDTVAASRGGDRFVEWPKRLRRFLDGHARVELRAHVDDTVLYDEERAFGTADTRISIVDAEGRPVGIDNDGRLQRTFETRSEAQTAPLLDSVERILEALHEIGIAAFPAYGTLLGAVREGRLLGHDSDADLAYVSRRTAPVDVIRESYEIERRLTDMGYRTERYSGAGIKVFVTESDGSVRGLDVFGGFYGHGHLMVMGEVRVPLPESAVFPLGTTTLEGRALPAPADTDAFLTATYGPHWRTPDPAFVYETPRTTYLRFNDWFRGTRVNRKEWDRRYLGQRRRNPRRKAPELARWVLEREAADVKVVDVGCGRGGAARWLARRGLDVLGLDYAPTAYEFVSSWAEQRPALRLRFAMLNLLELRHVLGWGARLAHQTGTPVLIARHVADAVPPAGRRNLWRLAQMACRPDGRLYLEFLSGAERGDRWVHRQLLHPLDPELVVQELGERGGTVVERKDSGPDAEGRTTCRMVVAWQS